MFYVFQPLTLKGLEGTTGHLVRMPVPKASGSFLPLFLQIKGRSILTFETEFVWEFAHLLGPLHLFQGATEK